MAVKIEVLDYVKGEGGNIVDFNIGTPQTGWSISSLSNQRADFVNTGLAASAVRYYNDITPPLIGGKTYNLRIQIKNYSGTGNIGVSAGDASGTSNGVGLNFRDSGNTTIAGTFTWSNSATGGLRVFGQGTNNGTIIVDLTTDDGIVWEDSIVGELDVSSHDDFPLALTFQISDIKNITATSGDYSKTFKIPATKNNNKIFKHQYNPNSDYLGEHLSIGRRCRILINDFYSLVGKLKVTGMGGYGKKPTHYDCVFYGNNLSWAKELDGKYMNQEFNDGYGLWGSSGSQLTYDRSNVTSSWSQENSESGSSPLVYPIVSYGDYNPDGFSKTIQLLKTYYENWGGSSAKKGYQGWDTTHPYGTPNPASDWRPAIWVKTTFEAIFKKIGYSIESNFFNTDLFKKLVWLLPNFKYSNPDERVDEFCVETKLLNERTITFAATAYLSAINVDCFGYFLNGSMSRNDGDDYYTGTLRQVMGLATASSPYASGYNLEIILDDNDRVDISNNYVVVGEYGYYDLKIPNFQTKVVRIYKGSTGYSHVYEVKSAVNLEVQTVGETSWNIIGQIEKSLFPETASGGTGVNQSTISNTNWVNMNGALEVKGFWLNKNDKIRITKGVELFDTSSASQNFSVGLAWRAIGSANFHISLDTTKVYWGQTYDLHKVVNPQYKQVDFVKGVAHAFNLTLTTDEVAKKIYIEPFNDFYKTYGEAIDWTQKLDRSKEIKDSWIKSDLKRSLVFKYKSDDKDEKVKARGDQYFDKIHDEYPYREELSDSFERGQSIFENPFFAGTYNSQDTDSSGSFNAKPAYSACLWETNTSAGSSREDTPKGFDFMPRLLSYRKYSPTSTLDYRHQVIVESWVNMLESIVPDASASLSLGGVMSNIFPQATSINRHSNQMPVLSYGNAWISNYDENGNYASSVAGKGLFETYYKKMFNMIQTNPRVRTAYITLKLTDVIKLDFRKLVYMDGAYWRINKIIDYQPHNNKATKVELLYWVETGAFAASAPSFGNSSSGNWGTGIYDYQVDLPAEPDDGGAFG